MKSINKNSDKVSKTETNTPTKLKFSDYKQKKKQEEDEQISTISPAKCIQKLKMTLGIMAHDRFSCDFWFPSS